MVSDLGQDAPAIDIGQVVQCHQCMVVVSARAGLALSAKPNIQRQQFVGAVAQFVCTAHALESASSPAAQPNAAARGGTLAKSYATPPSTCFRFSAPSISCDRLISAAKSR